MDKVSIETICQGAALEIFERSVGALVENIRDVNTDAEQKRKITLDFIFTPFADRTGATVHIECKQSLANAEKVKGTIHIGRNEHGEVHAYPADPRQETFVFEKTPANRQ